MKALNNYFQKATAILVVFMLLVIPNLHVYSSIGSYKIASSAITANNTLIITQPECKKCSYQQNERQVTYFGMPATMVRAGDRAFYEYLASQGIDISDALDRLAKEESTCGYYSFKNKNYVKYDFSDFDN